MSLDLTQELSINSNESPLRRVFTIEMQKQSMNIIIYSRSQKYILENKNNFNHINGYVADAWP